MARILYQTTDYAFDNARRLIEISVDIVDGAHERFGADSVFFFRRRGEPQHKQVQRQREARQRKAHCCGQGHVRAHISLEFGQRIRIKRQRDVIFEPTRMGTQKRDQEFAVSLRER